jgi:hypothetical protein
VSVLADADPASGADDKGVMKVFHESLDHDERIPATSGLARARCTGNMFTGEQQIVASEPYPAPQTLN